MTRVRVALVDTTDRHTIQHCFAPDGQAAERMVLAWLALGITTSGRAELVLRVVEYPQQLVEAGGGE